MKAIKTTSDLGISRPAHRKREKGKREKGMRSKGPLEMLANPMVCDP